MTHETLDNLVMIGQLKVADVSEFEIKGLLQSGTARHEDAKNRLATSNPDSILSGK